MPNKYTHHYHHSLLLFAIVVTVGLKKVTPFSLEVAFWFGYEIHCRKAIVPIEPWKNQSKSSKVKVKIKLPLLYLVGYLS